MNEKEKAQELVNKFFPYAHADFHEKHGHNDKQCYDNAKHCALIAVDEILSNTMDGYHHEEYWQEVKKQIELL